MAKRPYSESSRSLGLAAVVNTPPSPMITTLRVALVMATFTLLALSINPRSCLLLDLVARKMTRSASPPWLVMEDAPERRGS
eukprot:8598867-Pyramimonas_sp.AAC.1